MEYLIAQNIGNPLVLCVILFMATFLLEEAAILIGAGLAAAGELPPSLALAAVGSGILLSDWYLYGLSRLVVERRNVTRPV